MAARVLGCTKGSLSVHARMWKSVSYCCTCRVNGDAISNCEVLVLVFIAMAAVGLRHAPACWVALLLA